MSSKKRRNDSRENAKFYVVCKIIGEITRNTLKNSVNDVNAFITFV